MSLAWREVGAPSPCGPEGAKSIPRFRREAVLSYWVVFADGEFSHKVIF